MPSFLNTLNLGYHIVGRRPIADVEALILASLYKGTNPLLSIGLHFTPFTYL